MKTGFIQQMLGQKPVKLNERKTVRPSPIMSVEQDSKIHTFGYSEVERYKFIVSFGGTFSRYPNEPGVSKHHLFENLKQSTVQAIYREVQGELREFMCLLGEADLNAEDRQKLMEKTVEIIEMMDYR